MIRRLPLWPLFLITFGLGIVASLGLSRAQAHTFTDVNCGGDCAFATESSTWMGNKIFSDSTYTMHASLAPSKSQYTAGESVTVNFNFDFNFGLYGGLTPETAKIAVYASSNGGSDAIQVGCINAGSTTYQTVCNDNIHGILYPTKLAEQTVAITRNQNTYQGSLGITMPSASSANTKLQVVGIFGGNGGLLQWSPAYLGPLGVTGSTTKPSLPTLPEFIVQGLSICDTAYLSDGTQQKYPANFVEFTSFYQWIQDNLQAGTYSMNAWRDGQLILTTASFNGRNGQYGFVDDGDSWTQIIAGQTYQYQMAISFHPNNWNISEMVYVYSNTVSITARNCQDPSPPDTCSYTPTWSLGGAPTISQSLTDPSQRTFEVIVREASDGQYSADFFEYDWGDGVAETYSQEQALGYDPTALPDHGYASYGDYTFRYRAKTSPCNKLSPWRSYTIPVHRFRVDVVTFRAEPDRSITRVYPTAGTPDQGRLELTNGQQSLAEGRLIDENGRQYSALNPLSWQISAMHFPAGLDSPSGKTFTGGPTLNLGQFYYVPYWNHTGTEQHLFDVVLNVPAIVFQGYQINLANPSGLVNYHVGRPVLSVQPTTWNPTEQDSSAAFAVFNERNLASEQNDTSSAMKFTWQVASDQPWLAVRDFVNQTLGPTPPHDQASFIGSVSTSGLAEGSYTGTLTVTTEDVSWPSTDAWGNSLTDFGPGQRFVPFPRALYAPVTIPVNLTVGGVAPDLSVSFIEPSCLPTGDSIKISWSSSPAAVRVVESNLPGVLADSPNVSGQASLASPGTYYIVVSDTMSDGGRIASADVMVVDCGSTGGVDLVISHVLPRTVVTGSSFNLTATVQNIGSGSVAEQFLNRLSIDGTVISPNKSLSALDAGESRTITWLNLPPLAEGTYPMRTCADIGNVVDESDETNNCLDVELTVTGTPPPVAFSDRIEGLIVGDDIVIGRSGLEIIYDNRAQVAPPPGFNQIYQPEFGETY